MRPIKSGAMINDHSEIIEIAEGKNSAVDDGYRYMTDQTKDATAYRVGSQGFLTAAGKSIHLYS